MITKPWAALCALTLILLAALLWLKPRPPAPCVILMSIDTLRADRLGCYGCARQTSPHIDAFAGECVQFMNAYSQAPSTAASHMSLFTGMLPPVHRVSNTVAKDLSDLRRLATAIPTLAEALKANGYLTVGFHGGSNVSPAFGFGRGFDLYTDRAIQWGRLGASGNSLRAIRYWLARSRREGKPLFLFLHHYICHDPYLRAPPPLVNRFLRRPAAGLPRAWTDLGPRTRADESPRERFWRNVDGRDESHRRHIVSLYDAGVAYADFLFGRVRQVLEEEKSYDRSLVILLSDHGEEFWEHGDILHWRLFGETLRVPLLVRFPGAAMAGKKVVAPVRMFDAMPTLLDFLGIPVPGGVQAASLMPLLRGEAGPPSPVLSFSDNLRFVRFLNGAFAYSNQPSQGTPEWLFDLSADPLEKRNLAREGQSPIARLRRMAAALLKSQEDVVAASGRVGAERIHPDDDLKRQLRALGYL